MAGGNARKHFLRLQRQGLIHPAHFPLCFSGFTTRGAQINGLQRQSRFQGKTSLLFTIFTVCQEREGKRTCILKSIQIIIASYNRSLRGWISLGSFSYINDLSGLFFQCFVLSVTVSYQLSFCPVEIFSLLCAKIKQNYIAAGSK